MTVLDREPGSPLPLPLQFRFDAGSPALDLLATRGYRRSSEPVERLSSPARLGDWLAAHGLPRVPVDADGLAGARELREAAYAVLAGQLEGAVPPRAAVAVLSRWAARPLPGPGLRVVDGAVVRDDAPGSIETVLGTLARELAAFAVGGAAGLRRCDADPCGMLYLDRSRGHRRRWCSMGRCGNSAKVARHRARTGAEAQ